MADHTELAVDQLQATDDVSAFQRRLTVPAEARVDLAAQRSAAGENEVQRRERIAAYLIELSMRLRVDLPRVRVAGVDYEMKFVRAFRKHPSLFANGKELIDVDYVDMRLGKHGQPPLPETANGLVDIRALGLNSNDLHRAFRVFEAGHEAEERNFGIYYMEVVDAFIEAAGKMVDPAGRKLAVKLRAALATADMPTKTSIPSTKLTTEEVVDLSRVTERDITLRERLDILETLAQVVEGDRALIRTAIDEFVRVGSLVDESYAGFSFRYGKEGLKVKRKRVVLVGVPYRQVTRTIKRRYRNDRKLTFPLPLEHRATRKEMHAALRRMIEAAPRLLADTQQAAKDKGSLRAETRQAVERAIQP
jgi:hypothetical protein